jgi:hypothetical protein
VLSPRFFGVATLAVIAITLSSACGETQFEVKYAPGVNRSGAHISVFGIKRDGLMSHSGWDAFSPDMSAPFGARHCPIAYGDELFDTKKPLAEAIDSYVRGNGVTDKLLDQLSAAAQGDTILLVSIAGRPKTPNLNGPTEATLPRGRRTPGSGGGRRGGGQSTSTPAADESSAPFQLTALFFSIPQHQSVGLIQLNYSGSSIEEALTEFRTRLETEFPGAKCSGWNWAANIDESKIRGLEDE